MKKLKSNVIFFFPITRKKKNERVQVREYKKRSSETRANHFVTGMLMSKSNTKRGETPQNHPQNICVLCRVVICFVAMGVGQSLFSFFYIGNDM